MRMHRQGAARSATACRKTVAPAAARPVLYIERGWQRSHCQCKSWLSLSLVFDMGSKAGTGELCAGFRRCSAGGLINTGEVSDVIKVKSTCC